MASKTYLISESNQSDLMESKACNPIFSNPSCKTRICERENFHSTITGVTITAQCNVTLHEWY